LREPVIVVEHMEGGGSRWLVEEYVEAFESVNGLGLRFVVSGVRDHVLGAVLSRRGVPWVWEHAWELGCRDPVIVLDMRAPRVLEPWEARAASCLVVGGIMGDHPPRGRGMLLVWGFPGASVRSLGEMQMSVHTASVVAAMIARRRRLVDIGLVGPGRFTIRGPLGEIEVELPYAYLAGRDGSPVVPERIRRVLERGVMWDEV